MQNLSVKKLGFSILTLIVVGGLVWYNVTDSKRDAKQLLLFHPDAVTVLEWISPSQRKIVFERKDRNTAWSSAEAIAPQMQQKIQTILQVLAVQEEEPIPAKELSGDVSFQVSFSNHQEWQGRLSSKEIRWQQGDSVMSAALTPLQKQLYQAGDFIFEDLHWSWCQKRPKKIKIDDLQHKIVLFDNQGRWEYSKDGQDSKIDSTHVERWLGQNCTFIFQRYIDKKRDNPFSLTNFKSIDVEWADGSASQFPLQDNMIQVAPDQIGVLEEPSQFFGIFRSN